MTATKNKPTVAFFPEDTFLEPSVTIDPVEMSNVLIERIRGIVGTLREGSNADAVFHPPVLSSALEQLEGNLCYLEKVIALWYEHDINNGHDDNIEVLRGDGKVVMLFGD